MAATNEVLSCITISRVGFGGQALRRENAQLKQLFEGSEVEVAARARAAENTFGQMNERL